MWKFYLVSLKKALSKYVDVKPKYSFYHKKMIEFVDHKLL